MTTSRSQQSLSQDAAAAALQQQDPNSASLAVPARLPSSSSSPQALNTLLPNGASSSVSGGIIGLSGIGAGGGVSNSSPAAPMSINKPAVVEHGNMRFVIHDAPTDGNLSGYLDFDKKKKVVALVRACEPTYDKTPLENAGIRVTELPFQDGSPPPDAMIDQWLALVERVFDEGNSKGSGSGKKSKSSASSPSAAIAVHCVAGLGRAPVLVCIALIEKGMGWMESVELVRKKRRGALNLTQLRYLETYKPRGKKDACTIM
jgi:protein tyrosine phosphatase type 4A